MQILDDSNDDSDAAPRDCGNGGIEMDKSVATIERALAFECLVMAPLFSDGYVQPDRCICVPLATLVEIAIVIKSSRPESRLVEGNVDTHLGCAVLTSNCMAVLRQRVASVVFTQTLFCCPRLVGTA